MICECEQNRIKTVCLVVVEIFNNSPLSLCQYLEFQLFVFICSRKTNNQTIYVLKFLVN